MHISRLTAAGLALALTLALGACATPRIAGVESSLRDSAEQASQIYSAMENTGEGYFEVSDEYWFGDTAVPVEPEITEPTVLREPMMFRRQYPVSLQMVAEYVSNNHGVPVDISADAVESAGTNSYDASQFVASRGGMAGAGGGGVGLFTIQYEGDLRGFLDQVAARTGNSWKYRNGRISIFNLETRTFQIHALPGMASVESTITNQSSGSEGGGGEGGGSSGGGGGASGSSSSTTSMNTEFEVFESTATTIKSMLTVKGKVQAAPSTGSITVTDVPGVVERVAEYVADLNSRLTKQVVIDVRVYNIDLEDTDGTGINWDTVWQTLNGRYQLGAQMLGSVPQGAGSIGIQVIDPGHNYFGSQALVQALAKQGKLSIQTSASFATLSNQPVPVQVGEQTGYVASAQTTLAGQGGFAQTSITTGSVTTGFSMNLLPVVIDNHEILMQMSLNLSSLRDLRSIESGSLRIESPSIDSRQIMQRVKITSGNILILSGFEQERLRSDAQGIGDPKFTLAGGSRRSERKRSVLVVTLQPRITG
jgi:type IVB pilus formation R64 PilN family outer membrane protein